MLNRYTPLYVPRGTVRAVVALVVVVAAVVGGHIDREVLFLVLGFYFGSRTAEVPNGK